MARFKKGQSGNPQGRKKGEETQSTKVRKMLLSRSQELIERVIELALSGDGAALKLCLDRICPPLKQREEQTIISFDPNDSLSLKGEKTILALSSGQISVQDATALMNCLVKQTTLVEFTELDARLTEIERRVHESPAVSNASPWAEEAECYPNESPLKEV